MPALEEYQAKSDRFEALEQEAKADAENAHQARLAAESEIKKLQEKLENQLDPTNKKGLQYEINQLTQQLETDLENVEEVKQALDTLLLRREIINDTLEKTQVALQRLIDVQHADFQQAQLPQQIALNRSADIEYAILNNLHQDALAKRPRRAVSYHRIYAAPRRT